MMNGSPNQGRKQVEHMHATTNIINLSAELLSKLHLVIRSVSVDWHGYLFWDDIIVQKVDQRTV